MKQLVLLAFSGINNQDLSQDLPADALVAHWTVENVGDGMFSIPKLLRSRLIQIRSEHMRWAYDTGFVAAGQNRTLAETLECGGRPSMWWTSLIYERHPRLSPHLYTIYKLRTLEILLVEEDCKALTVFGGDAKLRQVLASFCATAGIKFEERGGETEEKSGAPSLLARVYGKTPSPLRALARFCHWWWTVRRKLPFCGKTDLLPAVPLGPENENRTATIATYFPNLDVPEASRGRFRSNYWQDLHEALNAEAKRERPHGPHFVRWLFIRFPSPQLDFKECMKLREEFQKNGEDGFSFHYLEEFLTTSDLFRSLWRWFKIWISGSQLENKARQHFHFQHSGINFWPYMADEWRESFYGWRCLERCLHNRAFARYVQMTGPQRWTLFPLENCPWERMLTLAAHRLRENGPVFGAQHSTIRPTDFRYFDDPRTFSSPAWAGIQPDRVCGNGNSAISQWRENGLPERRLQQVEALRYLYLEREKVEAGQTPPVAPANELPPEPGEPLEMPARTRLLVVTSFFAAETREHLELLEKSLAADLFAGWGITIKPHPYLTVESWIDNLPAKWREQITMVDGPLALELKHGVVVWASNSTTAALEAAIENLALMVMQPHNDFDLCPIQNMKGLLRTGTLQDTEEAIKHLHPVQPGADYLDLNLNLPAWHELLGLRAEGQEASMVAKSPL